MNDDSYLFNTNSYSFPEDEEFLTTHDVAKILRKPPGALATERWRKKGPPFIKNDGRVLYPKSLLFADLANRLVGLDRLLREFQPREGAE